MKNDIFKKTIRAEMKRLEQLVLLETTRTTAVTRYQYPNAITRRGKHASAAPRVSRFSFFTRIAHAFSFFL